MKKKFLTLLLPFLVPAFASAQFTGPMVVDFGDGSQMKSWTWGGVTQSVTNNQAQWGDYFGTIVWDTSAPSSLPAFLNWQDCYQGQTKTTNTKTEIGYFPGTSGNISAQIWTGSLAVEEKNTGRMVYYGDITIEATADTSGHTNSTAVITGTVTFTLPTIIDDGQDLPPPGSGVNYSFTIDNQMTESQDVSIWEDVDGLPTELLVFSVAPGSAVYAGEVTNAGSGNLNLQGADFLTGQQVYNKITHGPADWVASYEILQPEDYPIKFRISVVGLTEQTVITFQVPGESINLTLEPGTYLLEDSVDLTITSNTFGIASDEFSSVSAHGLEGLVPNEENHVLVTVTDPGVTHTYDSVSVGSVVNENGYAQETEIVGATLSNGQYYETTTSPGGPIVITSSPPSSLPSAGGGVLGVGSVAQDSAVSGNFSSVGFDEDFSEEFPSFLPGFETVKSGIERPNGSFALVPELDNPYQSLGRKQSWVVDPGTLAGITVPPINIDLESNFIVGMRAVLLAMLTLAYIVWAYKIAKI